MSESSLGVSTLSTVRGVFVTYNYLHQPVTGLVESDFSTTLTYQGVVSSIQVSISEVGSGRYMYSFQPSQPGEWAILITHAVYNPRGWDDEFIVESEGAITGGAYPWAEYFRRDQMQDRRDREEAELRRDDEEALIVILTAWRAYGRY